MITLNLPSITVEHEVGIEEPFTWVAERVGLTEGNIRKIVLNYINQTEKKYSFETPSVLGIDELHLNKTMRLILTNIEENTVIDLIEDRTKKTVINALTRLKDREKIKFVAMDMWRPYKEAVYSVLPHAVIVIDKFHIVKMANEAVEMKTENDYETHALLRNPKKIRKAGIPRRMYRP